MLLISANPLPIPAEKMLIKWTKTEKFNRSNGKRSAANNTSVIQCRASEQYIDHKGEIEAVNLTRRTSREHNQL